MGKGHTAALPLGIGMIGLGAVLLFVAFHNLPSNVTNFPELVAYLVATMRGNTAKTSDASGPAPNIGQPPAPAGGTLA